jgi:hypothetical protein
VREIAPYAVSAEMLDALERHGWATSMVDLSGVEGKAGILDAFALGLAFPDWVGRNWDALDDALGDLSWWPAERGRLLLVRGSDGVFGSGEGPVLLDVLRNAGRTWADGQTPLVVRIESSRWRPAAP